MPFRANTKYRPKSVGGTFVVAIFAVLLICPLCWSEETIDTNLIIFHFHGPDTTSSIGIYISCLNDINSDGFDDIAFSSRLPFGSYVFYGGDPIDTNPDNFYDSCFDFHSIPDITGDGIRDGISGKIGSDGNMNKLYFFRGYLDSLASSPYDSLSSDTIARYFGPWYKTGFIDADQYPDLVLLEIKANDNVIKYYSGCPIIDKEVDWQYMISQLLYAVSGLDLIDFNGDSILDICIGYTTNVGDTGYIQVFLGPNFKATPDLIIEPPLDRYRMKPYWFAYYSCNIGDFNGDGWDDLGDVYVADTGGYFVLIYFCGPGADTLPDMKLDNQGSYISAVGDINNDGHSDLAIGGYNSWAGMVFLYLGGPQADSIFDDIITSDDLPPLFLDDIGYRISPAGDFNGDGIDDFMFMCRNFYPISTDPGEVFIIAGSESIVVDVDDVQPPAIPDKIELKQNYPNPFNPSTRIEFSLSRREYAEIKIYNSLGQLVAMPVKQVLSAGVHEVDWDGRDFSGQYLASGVYYYQLASGASQSARKMIIVK